MIWIQSNREICHHFLNAYCHYAKKPLSDFAVSNNFYIMQLRVTKLNIQNTQDTFIFTNENLESSENESFISETRNIQRKKII